MKLNGNSGPGSHFSCGVLLLISSDSGFSLSISWFHIYNSEDHLESFAHCSGGAQVLGRLCVDLKVCYDPRRNRKSDENKLNSSAASTQTTAAAPTTSQTNQSSAPTASVTTSTHTNKTEPATPLSHTGKTSLLLIIYTGRLNGCKVWTDAASGTSYQVCIWMSSGTCTDPCTDPCRSRSNFMVFDRVHQTWPISWN